MAMMRAVAAAMAAARRSSRPDLSAASTRAGVARPLAAWLSSSSAAGSGSGAKRPTVQVLHNKPQTSYVQVEQDIAVMQREIRDAYKYVCILYATRNR